MDVSEREGGAVSPAKQKKLLKELLESPGWSMLQTMMLEQVQLRVRSIVYKSISPDEVYKQEYIKGEVNGIVSVISMAQAALEAAEMDVKREMGNAG